MWNLYAVAEGMGLMNVRAVKTNPCSMLLQWRMRWRLMKNFPTSDMLLRRGKKQCENKLLQADIRRTIPSLPLVRPDQFLQGPLCLSETDRTELLSKYGLSQSGDEKNKSCWYDFPLRSWGYFHKCCVRFFLHSVTYLCWERKLPVFSFLWSDFIDVFTKIITENIARVIYCVFIHNVKCTTQSIWHF